MSRKTQTVGLIALCLVFTTSILACGPKHPIEVQRAMFKLWHEAASNTLKLQGDVMLHTVETLRLYGNGTLNSYEAYSAASNARKTLVGMWELAEPRIPKELTPKHQALVKEAVAAFRQGESLRAAAISSLMEFFDAPSPGKLSGYEGKVAEAGPHYVAGAEILGKIAKELSPW